ncbi:transposase [Gemmatimonadetes bacterium T265]|nr:transposase [Gemmatimonadetes bacterium T265]
MESYPQWRGGPTMPRTRPPYPPEFRAQLVALHRAGRTIEEVAQEFEPAEQTIRTWVAQAAVDERAAAATPRTERAGALSTAEREELARLRRENRQLKVERDILGKAAAWFARETGTIPTAASGS